MNMGCIKRITCCKIGQVNQTDLTTSIDKLPQLLFGESTAFKSTDGQAVQRFFSKDFGLSAHCTPHLRGRLFFKGIVLPLGEAEILALSVHNIKIQFIKPGLATLLVTTSGDCAAQHSSHISNISSDCACVVPQGCWQFRAERSFSGLMIQLSRDTLENIYLCDPSIKLHMTRVASGFFHLKLNAGSINLGNTIKRLGNVIDHLMAHPSIIEKSGLGTAFNRILGAMLNNCGSHKKSSEKTRLLNSDRAIESMCRYINKNLSRRIFINDLEELTDLSARTIQYLFKQKFNCSPKQYVLQKRLDRARALLLERSKSVTSIATELGFSNLGNFSAMYKRLYGELPSETLNKHIKEMVLK